MIRNQNDVSRQALGNASNADNDLIIKLNNIVAQSLLYAQPGLITCIEGANRNASYVETAGADVTFRLGAYFTF